MHVDSSLLYEEMKEISNQERMDVHFGWEFNFLIDGEVIPIPTLKVLSYITDRDYHKNFTDESMIELSVGLGTYIHQLFPNRDKLYGTLKRFPMKLHGDEVDRESEPVYELIEEVPEEEQRKPAVQTFKCILTDKQNGKVIGAEVANNEDDANLSDIHTFTVQLIPTVTDKYRLTSVGGIYRNTSVGQLIKTLMCDNIQVDSPPPIRHTKREWDENIHNNIVGVDLFPPDNERVYDHIILPPWLKLIDLPNYLQDVYGVYSNGLSCYLQKDMIYVFPSTNVDRYVTTSHVMSVANIPTTRLPGSEKTYLLKGPNLLVLATGVTNHVDNSGNTLYVEGNGYKGVHAERVIDEYTTTVAGITKSNMKDNMYQAGLVTRDVDVVYYGNEKISSNLYRENSLVNARNGNMISFDWENSDVKNVYPGMPVRYMYLVDETVEYVDGLVHGVYTKYSKLREGMTGDRHMSVSRVELFVKHTG